MYQANGMEYAAMQRQGVATMGNERPMEYSRMLPRMRTNMNFGREKLPWSQELWKRIDETVHTECKRTKVAGKFLPLYGPIDAPVST